MSEGMYLREDRIDFISAYCDRWCERCAFTSRCSLYAIQVATAMCGGDVRAGMELAVGVPPPMNEEEARQREAMLQALNDIDLSDGAMAEFERQYEAHRARVDAVPLSTSAMAVSMLGEDWIDANRERITACSERVKAAFEIVAWDVFLITVKLHRALAGRDSFLNGEDAGDDVLQNDWNGSAKVALISITRSVASWEVIAEATADSQAETMAAELRQVRCEVERMFPDAWRFKRPGFDEHG